MYHSYKLPWKVDSGVRLEKGRTQSYAKIPKTGVQLKELNGDDIPLHRTVEVCHKDSSHFITQSTGTCISRGDHIEGNAGVYDDVGNCAESDMEVTSRVSTLYQCEARAPATSSVAQLALLVLLDCKRGSARRFNTLTRARHIRNMQNRSSSLLQSISTSKKKVRLLDSSKAQH